MRCLAIEKNIISVIRRSTVRLKDTLKQSILRGRSPKIEKGLTTVTGIDKSEVLFFVQELFKLRNILFSDTTERLDRILYLFFRSSGG